MGKISADGSTGTVGVGGFAADEYREKYGCTKTTADEKIIFGAVLETDDSINSIYSIIDMAISSKASVVMFDIQEATGKQIYHVRTYMRDRAVFAEISGLYETRICFMRP